MVITPEDIIEYNRELVLFDSAMFRGGCMSDIKKHPKTIFLAIFWYFKTHWRDIKTRKFYDSLPTDPEYWIIFNENLDNNNQMQQTYINWLETNGIKYRILWFRHFTQYAFLFEKKEDIEKFKERWEWIDRGEYIVQVSKGGSDMFEWLNMNCEGDHRFYSGGTISFQNESDAVAFKLMWAE